MAQSGGLEMSSLAPLLDFVREQAGIVETPHDKGVEMTIKVVAYDTGLIKVNGNPCGEDGWLAATRFIMEMKECAINRSSGPPRDTILRAGRRALCIRKRTYYAHPELCRS